MMNARPAIDQNLEGLKFSNNWPMKCFQREVEGKILQELIEFNPDTIILDFVDERYNLMRFVDGYITLSVEVIQSGSTEEKWFEEGIFIPRISHECNLLWIEALKNFSTFLQNHLPHTKIIVHDAPWAGTVVAGSNLMSSEAVLANPQQELHPGNIVNVETFDRLMKFYAAATMAYIPKASKISIPNEFYVRAREHLWGEAPFHYVSEYYGAAADELRKHGITFFPR